MRYEFYYNLKYKIKEPCKAWPTFWLSLEEADSGLDLHGEMSWLSWYDSDSLFDLNGDDGSLLFFDEDAPSCFSNCHLSETLAPIDFCLLKLEGAGSDFSVKSLLSDQCRRIDDTSLNDPECFSVVGEVTWLSFRDSLDVANFDAKSVTVPDLRDAPLSILVVLVALKLVAKGDFCELWAGCHLSNTFLLPNRGDSVFSWKVFLKL